ncbi:MAG: hypothetical protein H0T69_15275 [Thermoleophilaceae bacterium]|nr:hypothetical protein [Thermoleophilaceae bacterium]
MPELERMLSHLGEELAWPRTPDLAASVIERLDEPAAEAPAVGEAPAAGEAAPVPRRRGRFAGLLPPAGLRRSLVLAVVALVLLAGTPFAAVPGVRDAVLDFFGLQGVTVERRETLPTTPPERPLDLGSRTTLADATDRVGFAPLLPDALGEPDGVYVRRGLPGGELSLAYRARAGLPRTRATRLGLLLTEFRGDISPEYLGKIVGPDTTAQRLQIDGRRAIWIAGVPHFFFYRGPDGEFVETSMRIAQNVLLLEHGPLLLRLEGAFDRDQAIRLARSLR